MGLDSCFPSARDAQNPPVLQELERNPVSLFVAIWCRPFDSRFIGCSFRDDTLGASTRNVLTSLMTRKADSFGPFRAPPRARVAPAPDCRPAAKGGVGCCGSSRVRSPCGLRDGAEGDDRSEFNHMPRPGRRPAKSCAGVFRATVDLWAGGAGRTGACRHRGLLHAGQFHEARGNSRGPGAAKGRRRAAFCFCDRGGGSLRPDRR